VEWLNYHHLYYFWTVARTGSIVAASRELLVSQPAISTQLRALEAMLGRPLFSRVGRRLVLTDAGRTTLGYAEQIFSLGQELVDVVKHRGAALPARLVIGVADAVPKLVVRALLEPAMSLPQPARIICREHGLDRLLSDLAAYRIDVVISDAPIGAAAKIQGFNHLLGECGVSFFASAALARRLRRGFPASLHRAPMYLPAEHAALRRSLEQYFASAGITPLVLGEIDDSALLKTFAASGRAAIAVPSVIGADVARMYRLKLIGQAQGIRERYYAISIERKLRNPAVRAICENARRGLFA